MVREGEHHIVGGDIHPDGYCGRSASVNELKRKWHDYLLSPGQPQKPLPAPKPKPYPRPYWAATQVGIPTTGLYGTLATSGWLHSIFARRALRSPSAALTGAMVCADTCAKYAFWCSCESWLTSVLFLSATCQSCQAAPGSAWRPAC